MKSTRASIHPAERHSVSLNQSVEGVSRTKLALLTTNPPPLHSASPSLHTHKMSQCQECLPSQGMLSSSRVEVVGGFQEQITLRGPADSPWCL